MKSLFLLFEALLFAASPAAFALTTEQDITREYVSSHPKQFSVKVAKDRNGLIAFTVVLTLDEPRYVVAHFAVRNGDRLLARSDTPAFTKNARNTFHFSVAPDYLATSEFTLGASTFVNSGGESVPLPGTVIYRFRLPDFASPEALKATNEK
jgi:hypothetical protein